MRLWYLSPRRSAKTQTVHEVYGVWLAERAIIIEPGHEKMCLMSYVNNKGADQPLHPRSLINAFIVRCLDTIISLDSIAEISRLKLASVAAQAGLCPAWSETPEDTFWRVVAHIYYCIPANLTKQNYFLILWELILFAMAELWRRVTNWKGWLVYMGGTVCAACVFPGFLPGLHIA